MKKICSVCGKEFVTYPSRIKIGKGVYCSKPCVDKDQKNKQTGENNPAWKGGQTKYICKQCGKEFLAYEYRGQIFCTKECADIGLSQSMKGEKSYLWKGGLPKCKICGKQLSYTAVTCMKHKLPYTLERRQKHSDALVGKMPKNKQCGGKFGNIKRGTYIINGIEIFFRSKWEANYALYLDLLIKAKNIIKWEYEAEVFLFEKIKLGTRSYRPDFKVYNNDGSIEYHEVKGYMDAKSRTKLNRMRIYYPNIKLELIDDNRYHGILKKLKVLVRVF